MATNPITNIFYENSIGETFTDLEQKYMNTTLKKVEHSYKVKMSNFIIGSDNNEAFFDQTIKKIKTLAKHSEPYLLGPVYYNKQNKPTDFQCNFTETGKIDEDFFDIANRGMIEEAGLCFKNNTKITMRTHSITRKTSFQDCVTYLVHSTQLEAIQPESCDVAQTFFNDKDFVGKKNEMRYLHKSQVFVYGTLAELDLLVNSIKIKPVKNDENSTVFYDDDIRGLATFSIKRLNRFRRINKLVPLKN